MSFKVLVLALGAAFTLSACSPQSFEKEAQEWDELLNSPAAKDMVDGPLRAEGPLPDFILESELRVLKRPLSAKPMTRGGLESKEIAITIDDGPSGAYNAEVLKTLNAHGVKATFFLIGKNAKAHPELVEDILREGHSVANHTWSHPGMNEISRSKAESEIDTTQALLEKIGEKVGIPIQPFFRFPYGQGAGESAMVKLMADRGLANMVWNLSTHDSRTKDPSLVLNTVMSQIGSKNNGGILLMHETHVAGVKALPYLLYELKKRGYKTVYFKAD